MKKPTLKDNFILEFCTGEMITYGEGEKIWNWFEPHLKKTTTKPKIEIDEAKIIEYNEIFPNQKSGSGKRMRCNVKELTKAFQYFFKNYDYTWLTILQATEIYVNDQTKDDFKYCRTAKYFCIKFKTPGFPESELAEFCQRVLDGVQDEPKNKDFFDLKVY